MLSLEERLDLKRKEEKEIEEIKERVLCEVRKEKTFVDKLKFIWCRIEAETGLCFSTKTEKVIYIPLTTTIILYTIFSILNIIFSLFIN